MSKRKPPLSSEERCREAFMEWYYQFHQTGAEYLEEPPLVVWAAWQACWRYLESRVTEFIEA